MPFADPTQELGAKVLPLFIGVDPIPGECLLSLCVRSAEANIFDRPGKLLALAGVTAKRTAFLPFTGLDWADDIASLLDISSNEIRSRMHPEQLGDAKLGYVDWFGTPLPRRFIEAEARRVSPASLRRSPHHRAIWMIKALEFCPESFDVLSSECAECGAKLRWTYARTVHQCETCKRSLGRGRHRKLPWALREDARWIADLVSPFAETRERSVARFPEPLSSWGAGELFRAITEIALVVADPMSRSGPDWGKRLMAGDFSMISTSNLVEAYRLLLGWPQRFEDLVGDIARGRVGTMRVLLGRLGKYFDGSSPPTPLRDLIRSEMAGFLGRQGIPLNTTREGVRAGAERAGTITVTEASERFQIRRVVLRRLEGRGHSFVAKHPRKQGATLYRTDLLRKSVMMLRSSVRASECSRMLGIPAHCVDALLRPGLLTAVTDHDACLMAGGETLVDQGSFVAVQQKLARLRVEASCEGVTIAVAMEGCVHPDGWAEVVSALIKGKLPLVGRVNFDAGSLESMLVNRVDVERLRRKVSKSTLPDITVSSVAAAKILGTHDTLVSGAVRSGLIDAAKGNRRLEIPLKEVDRFAREYVAGEQAARALNLHYKALSEAMRRLDVKPAGRAYSSSIWNRRDLERALSSI